MSNLVLVIVIAAAVFFYFWAIMPRFDRARRQECLTFAGWDFAHRGLWDPEMGIPENSLAAFENAIRQKVAIELDVRLTKDDRVVVIHDSGLKRLCGVAGTVEGKTADELMSLTLSGTTWTIPLLAQVLRTVRGRVPLLIEVKRAANDRRGTAICKYLYKELEFYSGDYMIQSFDPYVLRWFREKAPHVLTGQLASSAAGMGNSHPVLAMAVYLLLVNCISRPDFISYDLRAAECVSVRIAHTIYRAPVFIWTVRTMNEYRQSHAQFDGVIFERFLP